MTPVLRLQTAAPAVERGSSAAPAADDRELHVRVRLGRARFSPGEIDGREGPTTRAAVQSFQLAHGLESTGGVDERTWSLLSRDGAPVLVERTLPAAKVVVDGGRTPVVLLAAR